MAESSRQQPILEDKMSGFLSFNKTALVTTSSSNIPNPSSCYTNDNSLCHIISFCPILVFQLLSKSDYK